LRYERVVRPVAALLLATSLALPAGAAADGWRLAAKAGLLEPDSSLGPAVRVALEGAWLPSSFGGSLALVGELSWAAPATGAAPSLLGLPASGWSASARDLAFEAALAWRGEGALGPVTPYGSAGLSLHLARVEVTWFGAPSASTQVRPGLSLRLGAEWRLGGGGPFLELGWSAAAVDAGPAGTMALGGLLFSAGWRLAL
jgi:hypothetical protein